MDMNHRVSIKLNYVHSIEKKPLKLATQGIYFISSLASKEKVNIDLDLIFKVIFGIVSSYLGKKVLYFTNQNSTIRP